jgi:single-strand DNA-binding protein
MSGLPTITVRGSLAADPDLRYTSSGVAVASFTIVSNDRKFDSNTGSYVDGGATFLRCSIWRGAAENLANSLVKGARVIAVGQLRQREWDTADGDHVTSLEMDVEEIGASTQWATVAVTRNEKKKAGHATPTSGSAAATPKAA